MDNLVETLNLAGGKFVNFALPMLIQSSILILILIAVDYLLRKKVRAVFRYCLWMLVIIKLVLPPTLSSPASLGQFIGDKLLQNKSMVVNLAEGDSQLLKYVEVPSEAKLKNPLDVSGNEAKSAEWSKTYSELPVTPLKTTANQIQQEQINWQAVVFLIWLAAVMAMLLLLVQRIFFVSSLIRQSKPSNGLMNETLEFCRKKIKVSQHIKLKISPNATSPAVCGLFRPVILIPNEIGSNLGANVLRQVIMHELAHIKRGDLWMNLVQTLLQIFYFYNPLLWLANAYIRRIREQAVDEAVQVAMGEKANEYPETLLNIAKLAFKKPALSLRFIGVVESKSQLNERIKKMLNQPIPKTAKLGFANLAIIIASAVVLLPMAAATEKDESIATETKELNERQKFYIEWTNERFGDSLNQSRYAELSDKLQEEMENLWLRDLKEPENRRYYEAINGLVAIKSQKAIEPLLKIATEKVEKDNRYRWQAIRALGILGDEQIVPELIPLLYHYNLNTRFWSQISLVRLTGENFGEDWKMWTNWWNKRYPDKFVSLEKIIWTKNEEWSNPDEQKEVEENFFKRLKENESGSDQQPAIVTTNPAAFKNDVSTDLKFLEVTFDRQMRDGSWSWTGGGDTYPETKGRPEYNGNRTTCRLPVDLSPGKVYWVGINSVSYRNFKSKDGVPASWYIILFATRDEDGKPTPIPQDILNKARRINRRAKTASKKKNEIKPKKKLNEKQNNNKKIILSHDDSETAGKWSFSGGGHAVKFSAPSNGCKVTSIRLYGSRYGEYKVPNEDFDIWICDKDFKIIKNFQFPYSTFKKRGYDKWANLRIEPTEVPKEFTVCVAFNPHKTKGIYLYHDKAGSGNSFKGIPPSDMQPFKDGDWMIRAVMEKPVASAMILGMSPLEAPGAISGMPGMAMMPMAAPQHKLGNFPKYNRHN